MPERTSTCCLSTTPPLPPQAHQQLWAGLTELGLEPFVPAPADRLVTVNTIKVPEGVDWAAVCKDAMDTYQVVSAELLLLRVACLWVQQEALGM
jgi:alanine-glyoxylate transaminase/serine-glyoxylate transaminase/serine-pyruvate transaminase